MKFYYTSCKSFLTNRDFCMIQIGPGFAPLTPPSPLSFFLCVARWAESYDREKAWSSINDSIFSFYSMHKCMHIIHTVHVKSVTCTLYICVPTFIIHTYKKELKMFLFFIIYYDSFNFLVKRFSLKSMYQNVYLQYMCTSTIYSSVDSFPTWKW